MYESPTSNFTPVEGPRRLYCNNPRVFNVYTQTVTHCTLFAVMAKVILQCFGGLCIHVCKTSHSAVSLPGQRYRCLPEGESRVSRHMYIYFDIVWYRKSFWLRFVKYPGCLESEMGLGLRLYATGRRYPRLFASLWQSAKIPAKALVSPWVLDRFKFHIWFVCCSSLNSVKDLIHITKFMFTIPVLRRLAYN